MKCINFNFDICILILFKDIVAVPGKEGFNLRIIRRRKNEVPEIPKGVSKDETHVDGIKKTQNIFVFL